MNIYIVMTNLDTPYFEIEAYGFEEDKSFVVFYDKNLNKVASFSISNVVSVIKKLR